MSVIEECLQHTWKTNGQLMKVGKVVAIHIDARGTDVWLILDGLILQIQCISAWTSATAALFLPSCKHVDEFAISPKWSSLLKSAIFQIN